MSSLIGFAQECLKAADTLLVALLKSLLTAILNGENFFNAEYYFPISNRVRLT